MNTTTALSVIDAVKLVLLAIAAAVTLVFPAYYQLWVMVRKSAKDLNGLGAKVDLHDTALAGGAGVRAAAIAAPLWNQLNDPLSTGLLPPLRADECGEECCAMAIYSQHGVEVSADALRAQLGGPGRAPLTDAGDLVAILAHNNVQALAGTPSAQLLAGVLQSHATAGGGAIVLGRWVDPTVLHWVFVTRCDERGFGANDPWGGRRRVWSWNEARNLYGGEVVLISSTPDDRR